MILTFVFGERTDLFKFGVGQTRRKRVSWETDLTAESEKLTDLTAEFEKSTDLTAEFEKSDNARRSSEQVAVPTTNLSWQQTVENVTANCDCSVCNQSGVT